MSIFGLSIIELGAIGEIIQGLATVLVFVSVLVAAIQLHITTKSVSVAINQLRTSATTDLFHRFNEPIMRTHRRKVYHLCKRLINEGEDFSQLENEKDVLEHIECVCNSLDWAGFLVKRGLLNRDDAIDLYGDSLIRSWVILKPWIEFTRTRRRGSSGWLWENFEWIQCEAIQDHRFTSWKKEGVPIYTPTAIVFIDYLTSKYKNEDKIS
jgi:hypothetical protein